MPISTADSAPSNSMVLIWLFISIGLGAGNEYTNTHTEQHTHLICEQAFQIQTSFLAANRSLLSCRSRPRIQNHFRALLVLLVEDVIPVGSLLERQAMRDDERWIDLVPNDPLQQRPQVAVHVRWAHL